MKALLKQLGNGEARKAMAAVAIPALVAIGVALLPGSDQGTAISAQEWIGVAIAGVSCGSVVYAIPNRKPTDGRGSGAAGN